MTVELTMEEATIILRKAIELGNADVVAIGRSDLVRTFDSLDAGMWAAAITGIAHTVAAMQAVGFTVGRSEEMKP